MIYKSFPGGSVVRNLPANGEDWCSNPGFGRSPGEGNGNPLQYSSPGESHGQRSLAGCSLWSSKRVRRGLATEQQQ